MPRLLTFVTSFFWLCAFTVLAFVTAGEAGGDWISGTGADHGGLSVLTRSGTVLALAYGLTAAAFLWSFVTVIFDNGDAPGDTDWAVRAACGAGILSMAASLLVVAGEGGLQSALIPLVTVAGLLATANAALGERRAIELTVNVNEAALLANRMALGAAHNAMLSRISGRSEGAIPVPGREER